MSKKIGVQFSNRGVSLIELCVAISVLGIAIAVLVVTFNPEIQINQMNDQFQLHWKSKGYINTMRGTGYWIWDVNTESPAFPSNIYDPSVEWKEDLDSLGIKAMVSVQFLKENGGGLVPFSGGDFDGDLDRKMAKLEVVFSLKETDISWDDTIYVSVTPSERSINGILYYLKRALMLYHEENSSYPSSGELDQLVPTIIDEIPNNPYTSVQPKLTHKEEKDDWYFENDSINQVIKVYPYSDPTRIIEWDY